MEIGEQCITGAVSAACGEVRVIIYSRRPLSCLSMQEDYGGQCPNATVEQVFYQMGIVNNYPYYFILQTSSAYMCTETPYESGAACTPLYDGSAHTAPNTC